MQQLFGNTASTTVNDAPALEIVEHGGVVVAFLCIVLHRYQVGRRDTLHENAYVSAPAHLRDVSRQAVFHIS